MPEQASSVRSSALTGTAALTRFVLRRDRVRILVWIAAIGLLVVSTAASVKGLYPTQADLDEVAATSHDNAAAIIFNGPDQALDTMGGQIAFQVSSFGLIMVALMNLFMVGRQTRSEEESGRLEMLRALPVGRYAPATAALIVATLMNVAVGVLAALGMLSMDLPTEGSIVFGAGFCAMGMVFAGITLVAAQVTENTRVVYGIAGAMAGAAFVLRAAGDVGDGTLSWFSPIGWAQKARPFAGERWWPLLVPAVATVGLIALSVFLADRRDVGSGLVAPRPGPPTATGWLGRPLGLALRLQRGSLIAWSAGLLLLGISYGSVAKDIDQFVKDNQTVGDIVARSGSGSLVDSFLATSLLMFALIGSGFTISAVLRLRSEETGGRAEPLLATRVSRARWVASHLVMALAGSAVVMVAAGFGLGLTYGIASDDLGQSVRLVGASLVYVPAMWLLAGVALVLFGLLPRAVSAAWAALGACFVVGLFADVFNLPTWVKDLSPFEHIPRAPAADLSLLPLVAVLLTTTTLLAAGLTTFRHRDLA